MKKLDKEGIERLQIIKAMKKAGPNEVHFMVAFMQEYIDGKANCCTTCSSQIRYFHQRIIEWGGYHHHEIEEALSTPEPQEEIIEEPIKGNICECGNQTKDKRNKKCNECKLK
jgi:hypothetical protein